MALEKAEKTKISDKFQQHAGDTGSPQVQIALMTAKLNELNGHFRTHSKDHASRRGLLKIVGRRRRLLNYLHKKDPEAYQKLIGELQIRK